MRAVGDDALTRIITSLEWTEPASARAFYAWHKAVEASEVGESSV